MVHDQDSAVIMMAYSIYSVYAVCNIQVLGKESCAQTTRKGTGWNRVGGSERMLSTSKDRIICLSHRLPADPTIPSPDALERV